VARVANLSKALEWLKADGFWVVGADAEAGESLYRTPDRTLQGDLVIAMGAEGKGLRPGVARLVDHPVRIPMRGRVSSLNVATACAVILFDILRRLEVESSED
jgi:23S rRNA (guanosine2251-2'-O)-methyltransferase